MSQRTKSCKSFIRNLLKERFKTQIEPKFQTGKTEVINIDFDNLEVKSAELHFGDGTKMMDFTIPTIDDESVDKYECNKSYKTVGWNPPMEIEIEGQTLGTDLMKTMGIDTSKVPDVCNIQYVKIVQKRKHKKKRINKKWLKRYGYKQVTVETKGWEVHTKTDGTFEFVNKYKKEIEKITK